MADIRDNLDSGKTKVYGTEEALARIFLELLNPSDSNVKSISDVTPEEIFYLAVLGSYQKLFNSNIMKEWMVDFLKLRISRLRLGRKELVLLGSGIRDFIEGKGKGKVRFQDLFAGMSVFAIATMSIPFISHFLSFVPFVGGMI